MIGFRCMSSCGRHMQKQQHLHGTRTDHFRARLYYACRLPEQGTLARHLQPAVTHSLAWVPAVLRTTPPCPLCVASSRPVRAAVARALHTCAPSSRQARPADPDFEIIYRFPYIHAVRLVCRLKLYQTALTLAAVPVTGLLQGAAASAQVGAIGLFAAGMLYVMGEFFRRFVGILYLRRDGQVLKVAHLTFWGGRHDQLIPISDVVPFSELRDSPADVYFKLRRYSSSQTFYVSLRYGGVTSRQKLEAVFGPIGDR